MWTFVDTDLAPKNRSGYNFNNSFIDRLLKTQKEESSYFSILELLFPGLEYTHTLDIDHLHPTLFFCQKRLDAIGDLK